MSTGPVDTASLEALVRRLLADVAPDADTDALGRDEDVRDRLDLDSVDFLNLMVAVSEATGVEIPERDYAQVRSVAGCAAYLAARGAQA